MNERIRKLSEEAGFRTWRGMGDAELERFALLIMQECVDAVMEGDRYRRDYFAEKIKQRFGIE